MPESVRSSRALSERERRGVLITRPEPDATETAALVVAAGFEPVVAPMLRTLPYRLSDGGGYDAIVVTSRNAIPSLPAGLRAVPLLAVGAATAGRARDAGFVRVLDADGDATALAALVQDTQRRGARLLFAHGEGQGDGLAAALEGAGFVVTRRVAYASVGVAGFPMAAEAAVRSGRLRAAMFLSAATARTFVRLVPDQVRPLLAGVDAAVIGQAAADAVAPLPWRRVRVSLKPTLDEVLALL